MPCFKDTLLACPVHAHATVPTAQQRLSWRGILGLSAQSDQSELQYCLDTVRCLV
ncbi:hypothetical protein V8C40DRAFT_251576, partial [Trichoderma camerunense]